MKKILLLSTLALMACSTTATPQVPVYITKIQQPKQPQLKSSRISGAKWLVFYSDKNLFMAADKTTYGWNNQRGMVEVWTYTGYKKPRRLNNGRYYHSIRSLNTIKCRERQLSTSESIYYNKKQSQPVGTHSNQTHYFDRVVPGTIGEAIYINACNPQEYIYTPVKNISSFYPW